MMILEEKRRAWLSAIREHRDAVEISRDTGKPIPNLLALLAKLKAARCAYFDEYLEAHRHENEEFRRRCFVATTSEQLDPAKTRSNSAG